jgi:TPR repeat protein
MTLTRLRNVLIPVALAALIGGAALLWSAHKHRVAERKLEEAASQMRARADHGDAEAELKLGSMYYYGKGVPQSYSEALRWYQKAADQGNAKAQYDIGSLYHYGKAVKQNNAEALRWDRKAADQGDARAQSALGTIYYYGLGLPQDHVEAVRWYRKAAEQGDASAQDNLGSVYYYGKGVPQDYVEAAMWYRKAASQGLAAGEYDLGCVYYYGKGVPQDYTEAFLWYRKAAAQGDARAKVVLTTRPSTLTKVYLWLGFLGGISFLLDSPLRGRKIRDSHWRLEALTGLLLLSWVGLSLYGLSHIGAREPGLAINLFYFAKNLLVIACVPMLAFFVWPQSTKNWSQGMHSVRKLLSGLFGITGLICLWTVLSDIPHIMHRPNALPFFRDLLMPAVFSVMSLIFGMAFLTVWKGKPSARWWGIAASAINVLLPAWLVIHFSRSFRNNETILLGIGVAGLVAFSSRYELPDPVATAHKNPEIPGDGTAGIINSISAFVNLALGVAVFFWWVRWSYEQSLSPSDNEWYRIALYIVVLLIIVTLHELAHTATGLALGMRLRKLIIGPFQWDVHDGKWEFHFKPLVILAPEGATGVVPASADFASWRELCMVAAGPLINLLTGALALWIAFKTKADSPLQAGGLMALLGAWSLALGVGNLLPLRAEDTYSDGANMYQLLSGGPWADFHRVMGMVTSSLVTPLRPRDFDIEAIQRTARTFTQGKRGLLLRLFAYTYYLDSGRLPEAEQALREAESIYHQSASDIPAELLTVFVFGNAYLRHDAVAARDWWTRMEARKPTRFNVDYWKAYSALCWIEGNRSEANEAWEKSNTLAQQLPKAGEYEFDRYCCSKLRQAMDEVAAPR